MLFVFARSDTKSCFGYFSSKNLIIPLLRGAAVFPFVCQLFSDSNTAHSFFNPILAISFELIQQPCSPGGKFRVLNLLHPLVADACQPAFERLGFRRGNRLDDAENTFGIGAIHSLFTTGCLDQKGMYNLYPPFAQFRITLFQTLDILL